MPLVDRLRVKLVLPLTGAISLTGGQPNLHPIVTPLVPLPIGPRWLFETRELSKTTWSKCQEEPGFTAAQYQRSNMGEPAEYVVVRTVMQPGS